MKYGLIVYSGTHGGRVGRKENGIFNVGDNIQMLAMRRIYIEEMHLSAQDIIEIDFHDLATYSGDYVVLPVNLFFFGCGDARARWFPASPNIIPVFIGVHFSSNILSAEEVAYLREYSPVGCRDAYTLNTMQKYHIPAYLFGCISATLPNRAAPPKKGKVYFVDAPQEVIGYMPEKLKTDLCRAYHEVEGQFSAQMFAYMDRKAAQLISEYRENAALVITSRLHCASPCMAMGIPTILTVEERSSRFAWIDKILQVYTPEQYSQIDWNPSPASYEPIKQKMIELVKMRLSQAKEKWQPYYEVSSYFEQRDVAGYINPNQRLIESIDCHLFPTGTENYVIWGVTAQAEQVYQHISEKYPKAVLIAVIDEHNDVEFHGAQTVRSEMLRTMPVVNVIVTPTSAKKMIMEAIKKMSHHGVCVFYDGECMPSEGETKDA